MQPGVHTQHHKKHFEHTNVSICRSCALCVLCVHVRQQKMHAAPPITQHGVAHRDGRVCIASSMAHACIHAPHKLVQICQSSEELWKIAPQKDKTLKR
jgi:hypothetical protein